MKNNLKKSRWSYDRLAPFYLFLLGVTISVSCSKDAVTVSDNNHQTQENSTKEKELSAKEIHAMIAEVVPDYSFEEVQMRLSEARQKSNACVTFDVQDLSNLISCFGESSSDCLCYDLNHDKLVSAIDLSELLSDYGASTPDLSNLDISFWWINNYDWDTGLFDTYSSTGYKLIPTVSGADCSWEDIRRNCCVEWYYDGQLVSGNKERMNFYEATVDNASLCRRAGELPEGNHQFELTCRITHIPTGRIFERTECNSLSSSYDLDICPNIEPCGTGAADFMYLGPFDPYEFCLNCD